MMHGLPIKDDLDFDTPTGVMAALRESWKQAMNDDVRPISELWDALDDEADSAGAPPGAKATRLPKRQAH